MDSNFNDSLSNITRGVTDASQIVLSLFDGGLAVYGGVAERVNAIKKINSEIQLPAPVIVQSQSPVNFSAVPAFLKSESGLLTIGAISVLALGLILTHGK